MKPIDDCILCGGRNFKPRFPSHKTAKTLRHQHYSITKGTRAFIGHIVFCATCGLPCLPPDVASRGDHYVDALDHDYVMQSTQRLTNASQLLANLHSLTPALKLLDVGCACGFVLKVARDHYGLEVYGIEPSTWAVDYARTHFALDVRHGFIETIDYPAHFFDVVVMADVIEHLENPKIALQKIAELLKADGQLLIVTPDSGSFVARLMGKYWWGLLDDHTFYFSKHTLSRLLEACGFEVKLIRSFGRTFLFGDWIVKLEPYSTALHHIVNRIIRTLRLQSFPIYLNLGDQMVCCASKTK